MLVVVLGELNEVVDENLLPPTCDKAPLHIGSEAHPCSLFPDQVGGAHRPICCCC